MNPGRNLTCAAQLMRRQVFTLSPEQDVIDAVQQLVRRGISGAPVVLDGRVVGMFSERDSLAVLAAAAYEQEPLGRVADHMRTEVHCVGPDTDLFGMTKLFGTTMVRRLPVVDNVGTLLGLVLRSDVVQGLHAAWCVGAEPPRQEPRTPYERVAEQLAGS